MIKISNLVKSFGTQIVLKDVSMEIPKGLTTAIVGPSGTGKSVLVKLITGLLQADSGEILIGDRSMTAAKSVDERLDICSSMGVLFQSAALFDSLSLIENVAFPLNNRRKRHKKSETRNEIYSKSAKLLEDVGLAGYENYLPGEVSIGMRKRVGIARALVTEPEFIFFDEPNTGLDPKVGQEIYELIASLQEVNSFTGVVISHEIPEVFQICHKIVMLYKGQVQFNGSIDGFVDNDNEIVSQFYKGEIEGPISIA